MHYLTVWGNFKAKKYDLNLNLALFAVEGFNQFLNINAYCSVIMQAIFYYEYVSPNVFERSIYHNTLKNIFLSHIPCR